MTRLALSLLAGLASALGFAPLGLWPLTVLGVAALLWLVADAPRLRTALARGWWFGVGQFVVGLNWIATAFTFQASMPAWLGWIAVVLLSLYLALYPAVAAGLAWRWGRGNRVALVLLFAAGWILTEWLRASLFSGFAWNPLGVALLPTTLSWLSVVLGTYGLSGAVVLFAGILFLMAEQRDHRAAAILVLVLFAGTGLARLAAGAAPQGEGAALRIVQPNIGQEARWTPELAARNLALLGALSRGGSGPRLLIWPESAISAPLEDGRVRSPEAQEELAQTRVALQANLGPNDLLLAGGLTVASADGEAASGATNSIFASTRSAPILARYDKAHLVPYGEYLPMRPLLSRIGLSRLVPGDLDFAAGPGPRSVDLPFGGRAGLQVCYEIIFSGEVVDEANRPDFLFNPSNDAWFGSWGPPQHLAQARLRALEEGLPVIRATPTGISALVDAQGRVLQSVPLGTQGVIDGHVPRAAAPTLFSRFGNALPLGFALLLVAAAIAVRRRAR